MQKIYIIVAGVLLIFLGVGLWQWNGGKTEIPPFHIDIASGEEIKNWDFQGAYTGNAELEAKADAEIRRLTGLLGKKQYPDYMLYVSIANEYDLKGDGKNELAYLEKALVIDATTTGLAWHNAGQLFARFGAYTTARTAFERAAAAQTIEQYQRVLADFLSAHFPDEVNQ